MLVILFGLSGAGKSYIGQTMMKNFKFDFWDADQILTPEMRNMMNKKKYFTQKMRDDFTGILIKKLNAREEEGGHDKRDNLVVSQALYKEKNRLQILKAFPEARLIHVKAEPDIIDTRLQKREGNAQDFLYAKIIEKNFELPVKFYGSILNNNNEKALLSQIASIIS